MSNTIQGGNNSITTLLAGRQEGTQANQTTQAVNSIFNMGPNLPPTGAHLGALETLTAAIESVTAIREGLEVLKKSVDSLVSINDFRQAIQVVKEFLEIHPQTVRTRISPLIDSIWKPIAEYPNEIAMPLLQQILELCSAHPQIFSPTKIDQWYALHQQRLVEALQQGNNREIDPIEALSQEVEMELIIKNNIDGAIGAIQSYLSADRFLDHTVQVTVDGLINIICDRVNHLIDQGFEHTALQQSSLLLELWNEHPHALAIKTRAETRIAELIQASRDVGASLETLEKDVTYSISNISIQNAVGLIEKYVKENPKRTQILMTALIRITESLGEALEYCIDIGEYDLAISLCNRLLKFCYGPPRILLAKTRAIMVREERETTHRFLQREVLENIRARVGAFLSENKIDESIQCIVDFCPPSPGTTTIELVFLYHICNFICDQSQLSISHCNQLLKLGIMNSSVLIAMATALLREEQYEASLQVLDRALGIDGADSSTMELIAFNLYRLNQYADSEAVCDKILKFKPYSDTASKIKAELLAKRGRYREALDYISQQLIIYPTDQKLIDKQRQYLCHF